MTKGFTLIELLVVIGIIAILASITTVNALKPQIQYSTELSRDTIISNIKEHQLRAMNSDNWGTVSSGDFGIYFEQNRYILFKGSQYVANETSNVEIPMDNGSIINPINLPNSTILFSQISGEVSNFNASQNSITVKTQDIQSVISINKYGAINY